MKAETAPSFRSWLKDFFANFGTIFAGLVGSIISGVLPTFYPHFNSRLGYGITALVSLLLGSYLSYRKVATRAIQLEAELALSKSRRQCEIKLLSVQHEKHESTVRGTELLSIESEIHMRNGDAATSVILKAVDLIPLPEAKLSGLPYWKANNDRSARTLDLAPGQQFWDRLRCTFLIPKDSAGSSLEIEYTFEETYQGSIVVKGSLSFAAMAWTK